MNLGQLRAVFRREAGDTAAPWLWADEDVNAWLNEAQEEAALRSRLLRGRVTRNIAVGQMVVDLAPEWFEIRHAELVTAEGTHYLLQQVDDFELDRLRPQWRQERGVPRHFIVIEGELMLDRASDAALTLALTLEYCCLPPLLQTDVDEPQIAVVHHRHLLDWVLFRAFEVPDREVFDPQRSANCRQRFVRYFGRDPVAQLRHPQSVNNPHHNRCWW